MATVLLVLEETSADSDYIQQLVFMAHPINSHVCDGMHRLQWLEQAMAAKGKTKYSTILKVTVDEGSHSVLRISMQNIRQAIMWKRSTIGRLTLPKRVINKRSWSGSTETQCQYSIFGMHKICVKEHIFDNTV